MEPGVRLPRTQVNATSGINRNWLAWATVLILLLVQGFLFYRFAVREITWAYPTNGDQLANLQASYRTYEAMRQEGIVKGTEDGLGIRPWLVPLSAQGATLHVQAALLYLLTGPSRLAAISLNLLYWCLLQVFLVSTLRAISGRWSVAFIGLGLLLSTQSRFNLFGDLFDFRLDCAAASLFGLFMCATIRSRFTDWRWSLLAGFFAALTATTRFITTAYLAGIFGACLAVFLIAAWRQRRDPLAGHPKNLHQTIVSVSIFALLTSPVLWLHWPSIKSYYFGFHEGPDKYLRAADMGNTTLWAAIAYYPRSVFHDHLGWAFTALGGLLLLLSIWSRLSNPSPARKPNPLISRESRPICWFVAWCLLVPLVILTVDVDKSPVVGNVMVPAVVLGLVLACWYAVRPLLASRSYDAVLVTLAVVAISAGVLVPLRQAKQHRRAFAHRGEVENLLRMYDQMASQCNQRRWESPLVATDCNSEFILPQILEIREYECHHHLLNVGSSMARLGQYPADEIYPTLQRSDFAIITQRTNSTLRPRFPFDAQMESLHPQSLAWCERHLVELCHLKAFDRDIVVFVRSNESTPMTH